MVLYKLIDDNVYYNIISSTGALRGLNNNPETFGPDKRPIVDFAIENRKALLARQKREEKSKLKNPNFKGNKVQNCFSQDRRSYIIRSVHSSLCLSVCMYVNILAL